MASGDNVTNWVQERIGSNKVMVFSKRGCPYCTMAKTALKKDGIEFAVEEIDDRSDCKEIQAFLKKLTGASSVPRVFINGKCIGGGSETKALQSKGKLKAMVAG